MRTSRRLIAVTTLPALLWLLPASAPEIAAQTGGAASSEPIQPKQPRPARARDLVPGAARSTSPSQIRPQLLSSLELQRRAVTLITNAQTAEDLVAAGDVILNAYRRVRAAHAGIAKVERNSRAGQLQGSLAGQQSRLVEAMRGNLTKARFIIKSSDPSQIRRIEDTLLLLRTAISQTNSALAISY